MSDDRPAASACGATASRTQPGLFRARLGEQLVETAVEPDQCLIRDRRSQAAGATEDLEGDRLGVAVELAWVALQGKLDRVHTLALGVVPPPLMCRAGTR